MLKITRKQLPIELTEEMASAVRQSLQARYNSLLYRVRLEYISRLGLENEACDLNKVFKDSSLILGELYLPEPGTIFYIKAKRGENAVHAGVITIDKSRDTSEFFGEVRDTFAALCDVLPSWQDDSEQMGLDIEDAVVESCPATPEQLTAAKALMNRESRSLLEQIQNAGSIFLNKIECTDHSTLEERIHSFKDLGLINMDYAVLCRHTGQQILRVSDKSTIDEGSQKAFKCFICGNQLADEVIEEVLACTEFGTEMLKDRTWLVILVRGILAELGIDNSELKIYNNAGLPVQIFLSINGLRYLFVLCTEALTLDQAYLIGAHLKAYHLNSAVIISTERVTTLMKAHLEQTNGDAEFEFIDDINDLSSKLQRVIFEQQRSYLCSQLKEFIELTRVNIASLIVKRMLPCTEKEKAAAIKEAATFTESFADISAEIPSEIPADVFAEEASSEFSEPKADGKSSKKSKKH